MKVIFVAHLGSAGSSGQQRLWALRECGIETEALDKDRFKKPLGRISQLGAKLLRNPALTYDRAGLACELLEMCERIQPDLIWIEWPKEFNSSFLRKLKQLGSRPRLISFQDDNPWGDRHGDRWLWRDYFLVIPEFDIHLIKRGEDEIHLKELGAKTCIRWDHGVYPPFFHPGARDVKKIYPISFVGTCMDGREGLIGHLLGQGLPVHVFGPRWDTRSNLPKRFPANFHPGPRGEAYGDVLRQSMICLGLVSHSNHDEWTMRSYEVPACASVFLAERTPTHEKMFVEGQTAFLFSTHEECAEVAARLIEDSLCCEQIGRAAFDATLTQNWGLEFRMREMIRLFKLD